MKDKRVKENFLERPHAGFLNYHAQAELDSGVYTVFTLALKRHALKVLIK
jgi:hypothetical protein